MMKKDTIVMYPSPGMGHLISMVELGKLILTHHPNSFSIIIFITPAPYNTGSTATYINRVSQTTPSILFHHLPTTSLSLDSTNSPHLDVLVLKLISLNNPNVHQALQTISQSSTVRAFIIDFFCYPSLDVAHNLNIPTYYFFTSCAAVLAVYLYFPTLDKNNPKSFKDIHVQLEIPGFPRIPASDMPKPVLDRTDEAYLGLLNFATTVPRSQGILVNSFELLEPQPIKAISDGLCIPDASTPPVYYVGPLIDSTDGGRNGGGAGGNESECFEWLDSQPSRSVVFLCFGSLGLFTGTQLKEIAVGLERSGQKFLWVVRSPPTEDKTRRFLAPPEPDLDVLLPEGFLDRTKDRGLVLKSWAPQVAILGHKSVGGFVTHCGWNSVLEAVCAGVPMVAWPQYNEQPLNKAVLVEEMKLALPMKESEDGFVSSDEVEKRVRELMNDSDEGMALRERVMLMSEGAKAAMSEGGSSRRALAELAESWKLGNITNTLD